MAAPLRAPPSAAATAPLAQLAVQRSGQLTWLRRAAGQLWTLAPAPEAGWQSSSREVASGSWLCATADGTPRALPAPAGEPLVALLEHPRSGARFSASGQGLSVLGRVYPLAAAALVLSTDLRRLYAVTAGGALYALAAVAATEDLPEEPELLLEGLERFGAPAALAFGPAGLVLSTARAVVGINLRSRSVAPIVADLAAHPRCAALEDGAQAPGPAVAIDHRRMLYLAGERAVIAFGHDGAPRIVQRLDG